MSGHSHNVAALPPWLIPLGYILLSRLGVGVSKLLVMVEKILNAFARIKSQPSSSVIELLVSCCLSKKFEFLHLQTSFSFIIIIQ